MKVLEYKRPGYTVRVRHSRPHKGYGQDVYPIGSEALIPSGLIEPLSAAEEEDTLPPVPMMMESIPDPSGPVWFGPTEAGVMSAAENTWAARQFDPSKTNPMVFLSGQFQTEQSQGNAKVYGGLGLVAIGLIGGGLLAFKGKGISTGTKVLLGAASLGSAGIGTALAVKGKSQSSEASDDSQRSKDVGLVFHPVETPRSYTVTVSRPGSKDERRLASDIVAFDDFTTPFVSVRDRPNPNVVASLCVSSSASHLEPGLEGCKIVDGTITEPLYGVNVGGGFFPSDWQEFLFVRSITKRYDDARHWLQGCMEHIAAYDNSTTFFTSAGDEIVTLRHFRYLGSHNWGGWMRGGLPGSSRCKGQSIRSPGDMGDEEITWHGRFKDNPPRYLFCNGYTNTWMLKCSSAFYNPDDDSYPGKGLEEEGGFDNPDEIKGPMAALMQSWKAMRGMQAEATSLVGSPLSLLAPIIDSAKVIRVDSWWKNIESVIGKVFGIASFVCEVAVPIMTCINPVLGASIGTALKVALASATPIYQAVTMVPSEIKGYIDEGWAGVTDFRDNAEEAVTGWLDTLGIQQATEWRSLEPLQKLAKMSAMVYQGTSNAIMAQYNLTDSPFRISKIISHTPEVLRP